MFRSSQIFLSLVIIASPVAAADEAPTYACTDSDGDTMRYMIGPGVLRDFLHNEWAGNYCSEGGKCRYENSKFVLDGGKVVFHFDPSTGAYSYAASDGSYEEHGTCKPE